MRVQYSIVVEVVRDEGVTALNECKYVSHVRLSNFAGRRFECRETSKTRRFRGVLGPIICFE